MRPINTIFAMILASAAVAAPAQPVQPLPTFKVSVAVSMSAEYADVLQSNLVRELRKLDLVEVVDATDAQYRLHVTGITTAAGGFSVAVMIDHKVDLSPLILSNSDKHCRPTARQMKDLSDAYKDVVFVDSMWVMIDHDLPSLASHIAAAIDVHDVEQYRQVQQRQRDSRQKERVPPQPE